MRRHRGSTLLSAVLVVLAACAGTSGKDYQELAVAGIKTKLAKQLGFGKLGAKCDTPPSSPKVGDTFTCAASTAGGKEIELVVRIDKKDHVYVHPTGKGWKVAATALAEGTIARQAGLGKLQASCDGPPDSMSIGDSFACTATTTDGTTIELVATYDKKDHVFVHTTNLVSRAVLAKLSARAVQLLEQQTGQKLGVDNFTCGDTAVVVDPATKKIPCVLTSPTSGAKYDATITLDSLENPQSIDVKVAAAPRA